ncbi:hypothetical protein [Winogradskyella sp. SYSU M77433]|uniref:hypothetical protein n=1 Tax=Winogradskyella sp. SYSU M77433 TaxID=3042722 RepID=UPI0024812C62|nr:hypothetical protein [Winogradskyella sp. SYSU M77433]MDH7914547.1 hypothetical protein [Winogradskyella sp. SYSU M77433]
MNTFILIITGILGAVLTFYISENKKQGAVRASALLSLIVGLFFYCFPELLNPYLTKHIPIVFVGTSFIGMVSSKTVANQKTIALAGILFTIIYINKNEVFEGYGGALGTMAFIALLASMGFVVFISKTNETKQQVTSFIKKILNKE